jgi:hypothetical protein
MEVQRMYFEDDPRLRELCERASKELDHDKLIDLVRQINEFLEQKRRRPDGKDTEKKASWVPQPGSATWSRLMCTRVDLGGPPGQLAMAWQM